MTEKQKRKSPWGDIAKIKSLNQMVLDGIRKAEWVGCSECWSLEHNSRITRIEDGVRIFQHEYVNNYAKAYKLWYLKKVQCSDCGYIYPLPEGFQVEIPEELEGI